VVVESTVDVGELRFEGGALLAELLGLVGSTVDVVDLVGELFDVAGLGADLGGQHSDCDMGVADVVLVSSSVEGPVALGDGVVGGLEPGGGSLELLGGLVAAVAGRLVLAGEILEVGTELVEGGGESGLVVEEALNFSGGEGAGSAAAGEFGLAGVGGLVDPAACDGVGEHVVGGVFAGDDDVGVVVVSFEPHPGKGTGRQTHR
jgi:hypothetical protein